MPVHFIPSSYVLSVVISVKKITCQNWNKNHKKPQKDSLYVQSYTHDIHSPMP